MEVVVVVLVRVVVAVVVAVVVVAVTAVAVAGNSSSNGSRGCSCERWQWQWVMVANTVLAGIVLLAGLAVSSRTATESELNQPINKRKRVAFNCSDHHI